MPTAPTPAPSVVDCIAAEAYAWLAERFPVACASDEFYFFPQALDSDRPYANWDDFRRDIVDEAVDRLAGWERMLEKLELDNDESGQIDAQQLQQALGTLREQLDRIGHHRQQPTFHLSIAAAGLGAVVADGRPAEIDRCLDGLPGLLQRAQDCLAEIPELFLQTGLQMAADLQAWIAGLPATEQPRARAVAAVADFRRFLNGQSPAGSCLLGPEMIELLFDRHFGGGLDLVDVREVLAREQEEMQSLLARETDRLGPGRSWQEADRRLVADAEVTDDSVARYRSELQQLELHCHRHGLVPGELGEAAPLEVAVVPAALRAIRAAEAYAARPGHPARGGVFYVLPSQGIRAGLTPEYRFTAVHETWPGHHLLDVCRWQLLPPVRRPLERPLFYEGWACLAEELMVRSGYLQGPWDRFLLARRRLVRAVRGVIDLDLHCGRLTLDEAAARLVANGYASANASSIVGKYLLRPGYQVCYTVGLRKMLALLERFGADHPGAFAQSVLSQGEIDFASLEKILAKTSRPSADPA